MTSSHFMKTLRIYLHKPNVMYFSNLARLANQNTVDIKRCLQDVLWIILKREELITLEDKVTAERWRYLFVHSDKFSTTVSSRYGGWSTVDTEMEKLQRRVEKSIVDGHWARLKFKVTGYNHYRGTDEKRPAMGLGYYTRLRTHHGIPIGGLTCSWTKNDVKTLSYVDRRRRTVRTSRRTTPSATMALCLTGGKSRRRK